MKTITATIAFIFFSFFSTTEIEKKESSFNAELVNIEYFSICECSEKAPVLVRILYRSNENNLSGMKMEHKFPDGITITAPVEAKDKKGNIVYKFCATEGKSKKFTTTFISRNGKRSNKIMVDVSADSSRITEGTEPQTITVN